MLPLVRALSLPLLCAGCTATTDAPEPVVTDTVAEAGDTAALDTATDAPLDDAPTADAPVDSTVDAPSDSRAGDAPGADAPGDALAGDVPDDGSDTPDHGADSVVDTAPPFADIDFCAESRAFGPVFQSTIDRFVAQDALHPPATGGLVVVGSSSIRRWEELALLMAEYAPLQRGVGGIQLGEVALRAEDLVLRHRPSGVVVFAGTNDVPAGASPDVIVERFRCLRQQVGQSVGWSTPIVFIAITPTPSRWSIWPASHEVNEAIAALRADDPALFYADVASPFLALGEPPPASLFVSDMLHLNGEGYELWGNIVLDTVRAAGIPTATASTSDVQPGDVVRIDLGPDNPEDGERTPSPDYLGNYWNNWHSIDGDADIIAGEHLGGLVTTTGRATTAELVIAGGFRANGRSNGGLLWPEQELLGELAVGSATGDFFFADNADRSSALVVRGLPADAPVRVRVFGARQDPERRVTRYTAQGDATVTLQTSGAGAGAGDAPTNDNEAVVLNTTTDALGQLYIDVDREEGEYSYLSLLEIEVLASER